MKGEDVLISLSMATTERLSARPSLFMPGSSMTQFKSATSQPVVRRISTMEVAPIREAFFVLSLDSSAALRQSL